MFFSQIGFHENYTFYLIKRIRLKMDVVAKTNKEVDYLRF